MSYQETIDKYYPAGTLRRKIFMCHASQVAEKALKVASECNLDLNEEQVRMAAMLHDIGICLTDAPDIGCMGNAPYIAHGILGAKLLREEGFDEIYARVAERHTGAGLTKDEIITQSLPLPMQDYLPESLLEKLVCYADKFFSKGGSMNEKTIEVIRLSMARHSQESLARWIDLERLFAV